MERRSLRRGCRCCSTTRSKWFVVLMVAIALFFLLYPGPARAQAFSDVDAGDWFYEAVEALSFEDAVRGYPDGTFRPYEPITRAQFAAMTASALHLEHMDATQFSDISDQDWYSGAVGALQRIGVVQGTAGGVFLPARDISRQQAASLVMRALSYMELTQGHESPSPDSADRAVWLLAFKDRGLIAPIHIPAVANAYRLSVVSGFSDARFYPLLSLTRAQAAGILHRALLQPLVGRNDLPQPVEAEPGYPTLKKGDRGPVVAWMERRLGALSYRPGATDGVYDSTLAEAVVAFQKVQGLGRSGEANDEVQRLLASAGRPAVRKGVGGTRVEIDLTRQVLLYIANEQVRWTIPVASGAAGTRTPTGTFSIQRRLPYWRESHLGLLYKPCYFYGGYAIHGSYSVPFYPASHGCVRVAVSTMDWLYPQLPVGTRVDVYY